MNFLVVIPKFTSSPDEEYIFPVGIAYIVSALKKHGFSVHGLDLNRYSAHPHEVLDSAIRENDIDAIATGTISAHYDKIKTVVEGARKAKPGIITIVGGGVLSSEPELIMETLGLNFGVIGEGETTIVELGRALMSTCDFSSIDGLIFRQPNGKLTKTQPRAPIMDLGSLPFPDDELLRNYYEACSRVYNIVSSRSCPYKCTFCYHPVGDTYRQRDLDDLFSEIEFSYRKYSPFHYRVIDELFSLKRERLLEFCERIKPYRVRWDVQMRVSDVDPELLQEMRDAGCVLVSYGLESGSEAVLSSMRKHTHVKDMISAVNMTYNTPLQVQGAFIFGDTAETRQTAIETFTIWLKHTKIGIGMWPIEIYPGTPLYKKAVEEGKIVDRLNYISTGCRSLNITSMPDKDALQVLLMMYLLMITYNSVPAKTIECTPGQQVTRADGAKAQLYDVKIECPHCKKLIEYNGMPMYGGKKWVCNECYRRYDMQPLSQWRHWPAIFKVSNDYEFLQSDEAEMQNFLDGRSWFGNSTLLPGYLEIALFGVHYLVPATTSMDHIRFGLMKIFMVDEGKRRLDPVVIYDGDYQLLHHPFYLTHRVAELVEEWNARGCAVAVTGPMAEVKNLMQWTNLRDARIVGIKPFEPETTEQQLIGVPIVSLEWIAQNPPTVLLVAGTTRQRQLCEILGATFSGIGMEVTGLYSSGTNF